MALYDYQCPQCQTVFEANVKISEFDTAKIYCPTCKCKECDGEGHWFDGSHSANRHCQDCDGTGQVMANRQISGLKATSTTWRNWRLDS